MKVSLERINKDYLFEVRNEAGRSVILDNKSKSEGVVAGISPMELVLMGVAGCSSIDIISILNKQKQNFEDLIIDVEGDRENGELPALFKKIHADVRFIGNLDPQKAFRACELSFTKYCSVSKTLEATAEISFSVYVNGGKVS